MFFPTTTRPAPATTSSTTTSTTSPTTTIPGNDNLTLKDTGLTKVRISFDTQAAWAGITFAGLDIVTYKVIGTTGNTRITSLGPPIGVADVGTAVIDFVFRIAPGATPSVTMCKNYQGPAKVTMTRLTDAPTDVLVLTNSGTNGHPPQGQCENQMYRAISRSSLIGPVRWPARQDPRPLVLAHYFPWYDAHNLEFTYTPDQPTGPANTDDPSAVAAAVGLAAQSGIDGFIVEYEGTQETTPRIGYAYSAADARGNFNMALQLDLKILAYKAGGNVTPETLDAALDQVRIWASHPSQLKTQGQPVLFLYGNETDVTPTAWQEALARLRADTGLVPYVVAESDVFAPAGRYQFGTYGIKDRPALDAWSADMLNRFRIQPGLTGQQLPLWAVPVGPGYDDRQLNRKPPMYIDRAGGQRYEDEWSTALASLPDWVIVTTWNEYYEQTHVAPGSTTGNRALDQTARWAAQFHSTG